MMKKGIGIVVLTLIVFVSTSCKKSLYVSNDTDQSSIGITSEQVDSSYVVDIAPYKKQLDAEMNRVIGVFEKELVNGDYQSTLGNFIIDLILEKSIEYYGQTIDVGLVTKGGLRTPIPKGEVTVGHIFELMPFENELVVLRMKGETLQKAFEHAARRGNVQMSGVTYEIKDGQAQNIMVGGAPLDLQKEYTMVLSDYLAGGGDKLDFMTESTEYIQLGNMFRDAIIEYIDEKTKNGERLDADLDNRVIIVKD